MPLRGAEPTDDGKVRVPLQKEKVKDAPRIDPDGELDPDEERRRIQTARLLALDEPPTAIFAAADMMAIGAVRAASEAGLVVPADLSIVGFDDIETAALVTPRLTTVVNPASDIGAACAHALLDRIASGPFTPATHVALPTRLVVRDSA